MKFMLTFAWKPGAEAQERGVARFLETGGRAPEGVELLGRWTRADLAGGFDLIEADDAQALAAFALTWSDVMNLTIAPVIDDKTLSAVLRNAAQ